MARARQEAFIPEVAASKLAGTPYDLRHAAVSTWLAAGITPAQVAEWAGQSIEILLAIYAAVLDGGLNVLQRRIEQIYGLKQTDIEPPDSNEPVAPSRRDR